MPPAGADGSLRLGEEATRVTGAWWVKKITGKIRVAPCFQGRGAGQDSGQGFWRKASVATEGSLFGFIYVLCSSEKLPVEVYVTHVPITCHKDQRDQAYRCFIESLAVPGHFQLLTLWWLHSLKFPREVWKVLEC